MNLLSSKLQKANSLELALLDKVMALCQFDNSQAQLKVDLGYSWRDKNDPYTGTIREHLVTAEFFKTNALAQVGQYFTVSTGEQAGERYRITELYSQNQVSRTFVVVSV